MNALERYLRSSGETVTQLARRIGRSPSTLSRPLNGERNVSMDIAVEVEAATGGAVTAEQFMAICIEAKRRTRGTISLANAEPAPC